jgi:ATP-dependent Clp protease ATP-binding subunit ClpA
MFDRFTDRAKKVMNLARQQAQRFNHEYLAPEHMLLGILDLGEGLAIQALGKMSIDPDRIQGAVESMLVKGPSNAPMRQLPFTPRAKKVLELTMEEAGNLGHNYIGTEHVLLGLIKEDESIPAQVLLELGVSLKRTRATVLEVLASETSSRENLLVSGPAAMVAPSRVDVPFAHFSDRLKRVWDRAQQAARSGGFSLVSSEHLFAAMMTDSKGVAADVLRMNDTDRAGILTQLGHIVKSIDTGAPQLPIAMEPALARAIVVAFEEAAGTKSNQIGTGHVLIALLQQEGPTARILRSAGLELESARSALRACLRRIDEDPIWDHVG